MMNNTTKFKELNTDTLKNINGGGVGDFIQGVIYEIFNSAKPKKRK
ncbi:TPA: bacteriocin [Streptococcus suis]|nr:bacteriocin [Streptococcus suis]NQK46148.1 bacteriocin [Streptococcus suis]NQM28717.1 bacteriocin [Streptococcus suis]NRG98803.1 bacteriocin [Streptococcus suis]UUM58888.1 bacteriocin [Streptococcus suis]UUM63118.1 bacteriocin [Streptococcus suis]